MIIGHRKRPHGTSQRICVSHLRNLDQGEESGLPMESLGPVASEIRRHLVEPEAVSRLTRMLCDSTVKNQVVDLFLSLCVWTPVFLRQLDIKIKCMT